MAPRKNPRHRRFVEEYLIDLNATAAAKRAGYSPRSASCTGYNLINRPEIVAAVAKAQAERAKRTQVTADKVVTELAKVAFGDPRRLLSWGPKGVELRESSELSEAEAALVSEVSVTHSSTGAGAKRVKLRCKLTALNALGKHLGVFNGRRAPPELAGDTHDDETENARERLARRIARLAASLGADGDTGGDERG